MGKVLKSWSGMRKYLEQEMLAESLHGRVRYNCTTYPNMDKVYLFELYIDDVLIKRFSWETVNTYFINNGLKENNNPYGIKEYWEEFWKLLDETPINSRTEYTDGEFCTALEHYRNQPVSESLNSENPLERMFAILDRRVGKRTLISLKENATEQPQWLHNIYETRFEADLR